jgi:hypothetical protein
MIGTLDVRAHLVLLLLFVALELSHRAMIVFLQKVVRKWTLSISLDNKSL